MDELPYYIDDPLMDRIRAEHRLVLEDVGSSGSWFGDTSPLHAAGCSAGDWMDGRTYDAQAHYEGFDQHMQDLQRRLHAQQGTAPCEEEPHPD